MVQERFVTDSRIETSGELYKRLGRRQLLNLSGILAFGVATSLNIAAIADNSEEATNPNKPLISDENKLRLVAEVPAAIVAIFMAGQLMAISEDRERIRDGEPTRHFKPKVLNNETDSILF